MTYDTMRNYNKEKIILQRKLMKVQRKAIAKGLHLTIIKRFNYCKLQDDTLIHRFNSKVLVTVGVVFVSFICIGFGVQNVLTARCLLPLNYLVWEATRPLAECSYCANTTKPIILQNVTRQLFKTYAYSPKPIIVKNAISHWRAMKDFSYYMFKKLYEQTTGSYESIDDGCQFLNFKTDLFTLKEVFSMSNARVRNEPGQDPWYVGWGNCHPDILAKVRKFYEIPEFLPEDAEYPATENIFFGYKIGAVMHLDYIPRLMWQGQIKGNKTWSIAPVPECEHICNKLQFYVEPGDLVFLDTRLWYHSTKIPKGQFSMTVQSEYG